MATPILLLDALAAVGDEHLNMVLGGTIGIRAGQVDRVTIENVVVARALIGLALNQAAHSTVANCTVFTADACGRSVSHATDTAVFNNLVVNRFYQADSLQFCINGFLPGFGFNLARTIDKGPLFMRNRFFFQKMDLDLDPAKALRIIRTFDTAKDIPERPYIEGIYGVDLSQSPGYVIEFKLPLDESTYQGDEQIIPPAESGKWFWLGFMLNDNDAPGTDVQNFIAWPATFGMFHPPESGAKAIFE